MLQRTMIEWTFSRQVLLRKTCHTFFLCWCNIGLEFLMIGAILLAPRLTGWGLLVLHQIELRRIEASADLGINSEVIRKAPAAYAMIKAKVGGVKWTPDLGPGA